MSLRARLVLVTVALLIAGLAIADVGTYRFLRSFLVDRVDVQLQAVRVPALRALALTRGGPGDNDTFALIPAGTYAARVTADGVGREVSFQYGDEVPPRPALPADLGSTTTGQTIFSSGSRDGDTQFRVLAEPLPSGLGTLVVAIPLTDVNDTLQRVLVIEAVVSVVVVVAVAGLAFALVHVGMRPLRRMEATAGAIAAGDLSKRVDETNPRTEVGRLGIALNVMLERIEEAFAQRRRSEERLRRFVADASHELRTPLTSIRGYAELFRRGAADRPQDLAMAMRRIEDEGARMGELVDELLLLARLDQGRPLERDEVDFARVVADAVEAARIVEPDRPIDLESPGSLALVGDRNRLRQVVDNLLANARNHTPARTPVHVRLTASGQEAVLAVSDEGPGVPPEAASRLFEPFYRADPARARATGGVGLGLSIVAAVVDAHGGRVRYEPAPGGGACFVLTLPIAHRELPEGVGASGELAGTAGERA